MEQAAMDNSINGLGDVNDTKRYDIIYKSVLAGTAFRLDSTATKLSQGLWDAWYSGFTATMHKDEFSFIQKFAVMWSFDDDDSDTKLGVPEDINQLVDMLKKGRIDRLDIDFAESHGSMAGHPTINNWKLIQELTNDTWQFVDDDSATPKIKKTPDVLRKIVDKIVNKLSGNYYYNTAQKSNLPGTETKLYFENADKIRAAFRKFRHLSTRLLPSDMVAAFLDGFYPSFDILIRALKRRYGLGTEDVSMVEHFREFDKIIAEKAPMEFKIGKLRAEIRKMLFTKEDEFPVCQDFPGHKEVQSHKEEFTPMIHTLLMYSIFSKKVQKDRWDQIQKEYLNMLPGQPTDAKWHEHRYNLYKILDKEFKTRGHGPSINNICGHSTTTPSMTSDDESSTYLSQDEINLVNNFRRTNINNRRQPRYQQQQQQQQLRKNTKMRRTSNPSRPNLNRLRTRLNQFECRNCSKWAGTPKYHHGPYGGGPSSNCPYDRSGRPRPGFSFIKQIADVDIQVIEDQAQTDDDIVYDEVEFPLESEKDDDAQSQNHVADSYPF